MKALHKYTFYVSKTSPKEWLVRRLVTTRRTDEKWIPVHLEHVGIEPFDVARILRKLVENKDLREAIGDDGILGQVRLGGRLIPAIRVAVDLDRAVQVAEMLCRLLYDEADVSVFDAERKMEVLLCGERFPVFASFVDARMAFAMYRKAIMDRFVLRCRGDVRMHFFKLGEEVDRWRTTIAAVVMADKEDFLASVARFDSILRETAEKRGEEVSSRDGCFTIVGDAFTLQFVLEGAGKRADRMGWVENGVTHECLLRRQGVWDVLSKIEKMPWGELEHVQSRLFDRQYYKSQNGFDTPADRFVASYRMSRMLAKHGLHIVYGDMPNLHSEYVFYAADIDFGANSTSSRIYFSDEDQAMPILDVIHEVIPYCFNYYYDTLYVRKEEKALIVDKMKAIRCVVSRDPTDPALGEVGRSLLRTSFAMPESHNGETGKDCLVRRKKDIVALYDLFIWWMEEVCHEGFFAAGP